MHVLQQKAPCLVELNDDDKEWPKVDVNLDFGIPEAIELPPNTPLPYAHYRTRFNHVDRVDRYMARLSVPLIFKKDWKGKLALSLLLFGVYNGWVLHSSRHTSKPLSLLSYLDELISALYDLDLE